MRSTGTAAERWRELQRARGIPPEILAQAPASPWRHNPRHFVAPAESPDTPSRAAALALLRTAASQRGGGDGAPSAGAELAGPRAERSAQHGGGRREASTRGGGPNDALTVLDVGCGGGSASLAVGEHADLLIGVDHDPNMLELFTSDCAARGIRFRAVLGEWPSVAPEAGPAHAVVCHHVGYNTVDFPPFLEALTQAARSGVVMELTAQHPMAWLDPLWVRFHGLRRPPPATADDAVAVLRELGIEPTVIRWLRAPRSPEDPEWVARRLCLPPERVAEVARVLADIPPRPRDVVTLTWPGQR